MTNAAETVPISLDATEKRNLLIAQDMSDLRMLVRTAMEKAKKEGRTISVSLWSSVVVVVCQDDDSAEELMDQIIRDLAGASTTKNW